MNDQDDMFNSNNSSSSSIMVMDGNSSSGMSETLLPISSSSSPPLPVSTSVPLSSSNPAAFILDSEMQAQLEALTQKPYCYVTESEYIKQSEYILDQLFGYLSENVKNQTSVDCELCVECLDLLVSEKESEYKVVHAETQSYRTFVNERLMTQEKSLEMESEEALMKELEMVRETNPFFIVAFHVN